MRGTSFVTLNKRYMLDLENVSFLITVQFDIKMSYVIINNKNV